MSAGHARLSASAAHRWLHCPGSIGDGGASAYAAAGTFAHFIASTCLEDSNKKPGDWLGNSTIVDGFTVECDREMVDAVQLYIDAIDEDRQPGDETWVEMPLLNALQQVDPDMGGTADFVRYRPSTRHLRVWDFKFGSGTYVEADDNSQMKIYGLGAMMETNKRVQTVELSICQPRFEGADPVRSWSFNAVDILEFIADIKKAADLTRVPGAPLVAGEHCKAFCPNARTCPELERMHHELVAADFTVAVAYDPGRLAAALAAIPLVKERIKAIEEFAYAEATAGREIPGFKLVDKRAMRQWKSEGDVIEWAQKNAIDPYEPRKLLSPAKIEDKLKEAAPRGKKKEAGAVLEPFVVKVSSGTALVPVSDDRPPAKLISVDDFAVIDGNANA